MHRFRIRKLWPVWEKQGMKETGVSHAHKILLAWVFCHFFFLWLVWFRQRLFSLWNLAQAMSWATVSDINDSFLHNMPLLLGFYRHSVSKLGLYFVCVSPMSSDALIKEHSLILTSSDNPQWQRQTVRLLECDEWKARKHLLWQSCIVMPAVLNCSFENQIDLQWAEILSKLLSYCTSPFLLAPQQWLKCLQIFCAILHILHFQSFKQ